MTLRPTPLLQRALRSIVMSSPQKRVCRSFSEIVALLLHRDHHHHHRRRRGYRSCRARVEAPRTRSGNCCHSFQTVISMSCAMRRMQQRSTSATMRRTPLPLASPPRFMHSRPAAQWMCSPRSSRDSKPAAPSRWPTTATLSANRSTGSFVTIHARQHGAVD